MTDVGFLVLLVLAAPPTSAPPRADDPRRAEVVRSLEAIYLAIAAQDLDALMSHVDPSLELVQVDGRRLTASDYRHGWRRSFRETRRFHCDPWVDELQVRGAVARMTFDERGRYERYDAVRRAWAPQTFTARVESTWRRAAGGWVVTSFHVLDQDTRVDPRWLARHPSPPPRGDLVLPCRYGRNGCQDDVDVPGAHIMPCNLGWNGCQPHAGGEGGPILPCNFSRNGCQPGIGEPGVQVLPCSMSYSGCQTGVGEPGVPILECNFDPDGCPE